MIVVDASVLATALGDDGGDGQRARARLAGEDLAAPDLIDLEVTSVLRRLSGSGVLSDQRALQALADLEELRLQRVPHRRLLRRCWELRHNMTIYDAAYVTLAEVLGATLVTADGNLVNAAGPRCRFELIG